MGQTIPFACQDWASTKAAFSGFCPTTVSASTIFCGHFAASAARYAAAAGPIMVLQDTTTFSYQHEHPELMGYTGASTARDRFNKSSVLTQCGILIHSRLVVTADGLPLGLAAVKFWTRKQFKGCSELKRHMNPTRVPIKQKESWRWLENMRQSTTLLGEPIRCVHIGDRESDIYELFYTAHDLCTHFFVRTCVDRLAGDGEHTIAKAMKQVQVKRLHRIALRDDKGRPMTATLGARHPAFEGCSGEKSKFPLVAPGNGAASHRAAPLLGAPGVCIDRGPNRRTFRRPAPADADHEVRQRLCELVQECPRFGSPAPACPAAS
jgi:hypothetical protein